MIAYSIEQRNGEFLKGRLDIDTGMKHDDRRSLFNGYRSIDPPVWF